ncbi:ABC transporter permease [Streptomyces sp. N2-109]|uniref:ABC transporter permease n=1 Tax=Streptomyces gossypii TaxID=2883101 RepID=A0ABT2K4I9_9ACTN|nr:ABC transporter permease [Streptomyces gossypii]MCT2594783.1 ABC transporter permease [Streptomyces gossypii]
MTTTADAKTDTPAAGPGRPAGASADLSVGLPSAMAGEWTKIRTLRSTMWCLALFAALSVAVALLTGFFMGPSLEGMDARERAKFDPLSTGLSGLRLGMLALVAFGVLTVSSEYTSGTIRSSLAAVPRRFVFYGAKLLTGTVTACAVSLVVVGVSFFATQLALGRPSSVGLTDEGVPRVLVCAMLYTTLLCVFAMGLASVLRSSALTLGILIPLFFMLSTILNNIPGVRKVAQFLPDAAGDVALYQEPPSGTVLSAWSGMTVLAAWALLAAAAGYAAVRRRDA